MECGAVILLMLGALLSVGFVVGHAAESLGVPRIAAYVIVGILFSEAALGRFIPTRPEEWDPLLVDTALGAVAFLIGGELQLGRLRELGATILGATFGQSLGALAVVVASVYFYSLFMGMQAGWNAAVVLGAIALATAPAASIATIEEYKAKGTLTTTLLGIVAIDDALSIAVFTLVMGFVGEQSIVGGVFHVGREIGGALLLGAAVGTGLGWFGRRVAEVDLRLPVVLGCILLTLGVANWLQFSTLLSCMTLGLVSKELFGPSQDHQWLLPMEHIQEVVFLTLFTLAGTHFSPEVFVTAWGFILVYTVARGVGKYAGAWLGTTIAHSDRQIRCYLGLALLPQAGVSIGLAMVAASNAEIEESALIVNTILGSTIIFEVLGPLLIKFALTRTGEKQV